MRLFSAASLLTICTCSVAALAQTKAEPMKDSFAAPPMTTRIPVEDNYFGTRIVDNYRWLEDGKSPQTRAFIDAQNAYTARWMQQTTLRPSLVKDLSALEDVSTAGTPLERAGLLFYSKRLTGEQQASIWLRHGWNGPEERLIDPTTLSQNANTSISLRGVSDDARLLSFEIRQGGADEGVIRLYDVAQKKMLADELPQGRYFSVSFTPDGQGIFFSRHDRQGSLLFEHRIGTATSSDRLLFGHSFHNESLGPNDLFYAHVTDDNRYLIITIERGVPASRVDIVYRDLTHPDAPFESLVWGVDARFEANYVHGTWLVKTDLHAPRGRILSALPGTSPETWTTLVPQNSEAIESWSVVGEKIYVVRLHDALPNTSVFLLDGKAAGTLSLQGIGSLSSLSGRSRDRYGYFSFQSFLQPPTVYRLDTETGKQEVFFQPQVPFDSSQFEIRQVFYTSKDGTRVPMFIAGRKGLKTDGSARLLMTGYGGFNISLIPAWNATYAWWMAQGGWFALPGLRGGGEYGEDWHRQGMFEKKQNVFDDWFAAAEFLIANHYTSPARFAITGRSNGGLLMGASMTQRPELFGAILCGYPLLDMLRFQKFLVGSYWVTEYGSSDRKDQFDALFRYSPYHNVKTASSYPAVMFFTGDADTRVDPLHARKMTAEMQAANQGKRPILLHYSLSAGHSAGVSMEQHINDDADQLLFLWTETGH